MLQQRLNYKHSGEERSVKKKITLMLILSLVPMPSYMFWKGLGTGLAYISHGKIKMPLLLYDLCFTTMVDWNVICVCFMCFVTVVIIIPGV